MLLLRRLDSSLGRLIAGKMQDAAEEEIEKLGRVGETLRVRVGLSGSGFRQESLEKLVVSAFEAVECARNEDVGLYSDLGSSKGEGGSDGATKRLSDEGAEGGSDGATKRRRDEGEGEEQRQAEGAKA